MESCSPSNPSSVKSQVSEEEQLFEFEEYSIAPDLIQECSLKESEAQESSKRIVNSTGNSHWSYRKAWHYWLFEESTGRRLGVYEQILRKIETAHSNFRTCRSWRTGRIWKRSKEFQKAQDGVFKGERKGKGSFSATSVWLWVLSFVLTRFYEQNVLIAPETWSFCDLNTPPCSQLETTGKSYCRFTRPPASRNEGIIGVELYFETE